MTEKDLSGGTGRSSVLKVVGEGLIDVGEQGELKRVLGLRLDQHDALLSPSDVLHAERAYI
jgi:hypothetical protein